MQFNMRRIIFCNRLFLRYSRIRSLFLIFNTRKQSSSSLRWLVSIVYIHFSLIIINTNFIFFSFNYITKRNSSSCLGLHLTVSYSFNTMWGVSKFSHKCFNIFLLQKVFVVYIQYIFTYIRMLLFSNYPHLCNKWLYFKKKISRACVSYSRSGHLVSSLTIFLN